MILESDWELKRLAPGYIIKPFDCEDGDLNDFLLNDSIQYLIKRVAVTYILENQERTIAFYSVLNDKIAIKDVGGHPNEWALFQKLVKKKLIGYPAVKIGRLGVDKHFKNRGIGTTLINYIKYDFTNKNKTGCRFITVDAYQQSLEFYKKMGFICLTEKDKSKPTRLMYFDLASII